MSLKTHIVDSFGTRQGAKVNPEGTLEVVVHPHPPQNEQQSATPYRGYFTRDNDGSTISMLVDGSTNAIDFEVKAGTDTDRYVKTISWLIADASSVLNTFGNITALSTGIEVFWETQEKGKIVIADSLKTNFDVIRLCAGSPSFGTGADAFRAANVTAPPGNAEAYIPVLDCAAIFGLPYGLRLRAATQDRVTIRIKDDITGIDQMDVIAYGLEI